MFKRTVIGIICTCIVAVGGFFVSNESSALYKAVWSKQTQSGHVIIIDAGHGGLPNTID